LARLRLAQGAPAEVSERAIRAWIAAEDVDDPAPWKALATATADDPGRSAEHLEALRAAAQRDPASVEVYRGLLRAFQALDDPGGVQVVASLLVFLKAATPSESALVGDDLPIAGLDDDARLSWVDDPEAEGPVGRAFERLLEPAGVLFDRTEGELGLAGARRIDMDTQRALPERFHEVAAALGLEGRALLQRPEGAAAIDVSVGPPPTVVVDKGLSKGMFRKEQRYVLARALSLTRGARPAVRALHPADGQALVDALRGADQGRAGEWRGLLSQLLTPEELDTAAEPLLESPDATFVEWAEAVERSAARAAYVICGDLGTALQAQRREAGGDFRKPLRNPEALADLAARSPLARDLLEFALSPSHLRLLRWAGGEGGLLDDVEGGDLEASVEH